VLADWNGDGYLDLAVVNQASNSVSMLLGRGDGGFEPARDIAVGVGPWDIVAADADHDGRMDLMVALAGDSGTPGQIVFLRGQGDGAFGPGVAFGVGDHSRMLTAADFDADGSIDVAATSPFTQTVSVYRGAGNGTFAAKEDYGTGPNATRLAVGDVNSDGMPDLAVATTSPGAVTLLLHTDIDLPTPAAFSFIDATWTADGVALRWASSNGAAITIERSGTSTGPWVRITPDVEVRDDIFTAVDRDVDRANSHYYRIVAGSAASEAMFVEALRTPALALSVAPNPARRIATISYTLSRPGRVRLTVADVQGRVIARPVDMMQSPGAHEVAFDVRAQRAGVVFVRLEAEGREMTRRFVLAP